MQRHPPDSPQAVARVLALAIVADGSYDPRELAALDRCGGFARIDLPRGEFIALLRELFSWLMCRMARDGHASLLDDEVIDRLAAEVRRPDLQLLTCGLLMEILPADGRLSQAELAVLQRLLERWQPPRQSLADVLAGSAQPSAAEARSQPRT